MQVTADIWFLLQKSSVSGEMNLKQYNTTLQERESCLKYSHEHIIGKIDRKQTVRLIPGVPKYVPYFEV